jgi:hypothetical protein
MVLSPTFARDGTAFWPVSNGVMLHRDSGSRLLSIAMDGAPVSIAIMPAADYSSSGRLLVLTTARSGALSLLVSVHDQPFAAADANLDPATMIASDMTLLGDGDLLVPRAPVSSADRTYGTACSHDTGRTWRTSC